MEEMKVLLVDDEADLVNTLAERLALRDIHAEVVTDGKGAIRRVEEKPYDVVVLDVVLQHARGLDVLKEIKRIRPRQVVILLSGRGSDEDFAEGQRIGAFDYLIKPVNIDKLIEKMEQAVSTGKI